MCYAVIYKVVFYIKVGVLGIIIAFMHLNNYNVIINNYLIYKG